MATSLDNSRAAQKAMCKVDCDGDPGHACYLGENDGTDCVIGFEIPTAPGSNEGYRCCKVKTNATFVRTARSILAYANQVANAGTQNARTTLTNLFNDNDMQIPMGHGQSHFTGGALSTRRFGQGMQRDLLKLLDKIVPTSAYEVLCNVSVILAQPQYRRAKPNIAYFIRPENETVLPNDTLTLATNLSINIRHLSRARLEVWIQHALQSSQPRSEKALLTINVVFPLETKLDRRYFDRIRTYLVRTRFRGKITVHFGGGGAIEDNVIWGTDLSPSASEVTYTLLQDPGKLEIKVS